MNKTTMIRSLGWLIGLILLFSWPVQAEGNPPHQSVQFTKFFDVSTQVNPPGPTTPISLTATAGVPFTYEIPVLIPENNAGYTSPQLPANGLGLSYDTYPPSISGAPNATGVMNLTINASNMSNGQAHRAWVPIRITVTAPTPISLTATAGVPFTYHIPVLLNPNNTFYTSPQLPANGLSTSYSTYPPSIVGTPLASGVMNLTINASNGKPESAWVPIILTVNPSPGSALTLLAPTYNCTTGAFHFNTSGGDGSPITYFAIGITGLTTNPDQFVDVDQRTASDAPPILLQATQNGTTVTYLWDIRAQCPVNQPGGTLTLLAPTYNCTTGAFHFNTNGGDSTPITFSAIGITGPTTNPDQFVDTGLRMAADAQPLHLQATQSGVTVSYVWDIRTQCPVGPTPPSSALTLLAPTYNCTTGAFHFNTNGGDGTPITFSAIGITGPTTNPDQFVDTELRTVTDVQPILLQAIQNGTSVTYLWNLKAACGRARLSALEPARRLSVKLLGNPVLGDLVYIEVSGAEGQPLSVALIDQQGRPVSEERIIKATAVERLEVRLARWRGMQLLQVRTPDQTEVVRVVKTD